MRILLLLITCLLIGVETFAQQLGLEEFVLPDYYRKDTVYVMNGYRYRCDGTRGIVVIYNADYQNKWVEQNQVYKATGKYFDSDWGKLNPIIDDSSMDQKVRNIIDNAFSKEFVKQFESYDWLTVNMYLNSDTGKVEEVSFWFTHRSPYATLSLSTFRNIELKLIRDIRYATTSIGKQLNYIFLGTKRIPLGASE